MSITSFTHRHIINGYIVVHSHPFNPVTGDNTKSHQHSKNGFVLIDLLTHFLATALFVATIIGAIYIVLQSVLFQSIDKHFERHLFLCSNGLRAPPSNIHN